MIMIKMIEIMMTTMMMILTTIKVMIMMPMKVMTLTMRVIVTMMMMLMIKQLDILVTGQSLVSRDGSLGEHLMERSTHPVLSQDIKEDQHSRCFLVQQ